MPGDRRKIPRSVTVTPAQVHIGRWGKLAWFPYDTLIGVLLVISGVGNLLEPEVLAPGAPLWTSIANSSILLIGGVGMLGGMWWMSNRVEVLGNICLVGGIAISTTTALVYHGRGTLKTSLVFVAVAWAVGVRINGLLKGRSLVQIEAVTHE